MLPCCQEIKNSYTQKAHQCRKEHTHLTAENQGQPAYYPEAFYSAVICLKKALKTNRLKESDLPQNIESSWDRHAAGPDLEGHGQALFRSANVLK